MKIAFRISIFVLFLVAPPIFGEMLEPPSEFSSIFSEISILESSITKGDWETAEKKAQKLGTLLNEISSRVIKSSGMTKHDHLVDSLQSLKKVLKSKDSSLVFDQLLLVEKLLFQTMENFNYLLFPAILLINEHINEAVEATSRNDYERILHEMEEVTIIIEDSSDKLFEIGIGKGMQNDLLNFRESVITAVDKKDGETLTLELKRMKKLSRAFIWIGRQP